MKDNLDELTRELGFSNICGVDEAGRGPLAGPVVACALVLRPDAKILGIDDSKALSEKKRKALLPQIYDNSISCAIGMSWNEEIDRINILKATMKSMAQAVISLTLIPSIALIDGKDVPKGLPCFGLALIKGDQRSASVAAASIVAKVVRDEIMDMIHEEHPEYGFCKHKGYPTKKHYEALRAFGPSKYHRITFNGVI